MVFVQSLPLRTHHQRKRKGNFPFPLPSREAKPLGLEFWAQFPHPSPLRCHLDMGQARSSQRRRGTATLGFNTWQRQGIILMGEGDQAGVRLSVMEVGATSRDAALEGELRISGATISQKAR